MRSIAFMNLKKIGEENQADPHVIRSIAGQDRELLRRQIAIINPDVIVGGVGDSGLCSFLVLHFNHLALISVWPT